MLVCVRIKEMHRITFVEVDLMFSMTKRDQCVQCTLCIELTINGAYDQNEYPAELHHLNDMLPMLIMFSFTFFDFRAIKKATRR